MCPRGQLWPHPGVELPLEHRRWPVTRQPPPSQRPGSRERRLQTKKSERWRLLPHSQKPPGGCRPQRLKEEDSTAPCAGRSVSSCQQVVTSHGQGPGSTSNPWCSSCPSRKPRGALHTKIAEIWMKAISVELEQESGRRGQAPPPHSEVRGRGRVLRQAEHSDGFKTWEPPRTTGPQDGLQPPWRSARMTTSRPSLGRQRDRVASQ